MMSVINESLKQLFEEVKQVYTQKQSIPDSLLSALNFVFKSPLLPALDLVERRCVTMVTSPSGRCVYQVVGSSGTPYTCLLSCDYCGCPAYKFSVIKRGDHIMCKHILAVHLSDAMGLTKELISTDLDLADLIMGID
ncbi:unnamed protein product [Owenia fusiformis]|uniref:Uncharacterized protein n=1 Tax=Owenia fusiformis TaxID=6347 RepID=A0A8J1XPS2_OWEFU|nr:unnamed protein product [Owenia fusiformis]